MALTLVTGATGFLGWHIASLLIERGHKVRALVRPGSRLIELDAEPVAGDLRDPQSLKNAVAGCQFVYHAAADYRLWAKDPTDLYRCNVDGTRNVLSASRAAGVERLVYTSTVGCIGIPPDGIGKEDTPVSLDDMAGDYKKSKFLAEQAVLAAAREGAPVVIVNPTAPIGSHDIKPTPTGQIVLDFLEGRMPAFIDTGLNVVNARDCAEGHLLACQKGRAGERYILGSENLTLEQILQKLAAIADRKPPTAKIPYALAFTAGALSTGFAQLTGKPPRVPMDAVRMAKKKMWVSHEKAARELGFEPRPAETALSDAVAWFQAQGAR